MPSRRLGLSLGIDLVPGLICSLDCIYCESGATAALTAQRKVFVPTNLIASELEELLKKIRRGEVLEPHWMTFSGSSEPTLAENLGEVIDLIKDMGFSSKIAVLTNSTLLDQPEVRRGLLKAHRILPSFDAALNDSFQKINRPLPGLALEKMLQGLIALRREFQGEIFLEVFIVPEINTSLAELDAFREAFLKIRPDEIQLNTLDRPGTVRNLSRAPESLLAAILERWNLPNARIIARYAETAPSEKTSSSALEPQVLEILKRRPCTFQDLCLTTGENSEVLTRLLDRLCAEKKIAASPADRGIFYHEAR